MNPVIEEDVQAILNQTADLWEELRGKRLFITGGTGFFGSWILESFAAANKKFSLNANLLALSRDPTAFQTQFPHLAAEPSISFLKGDVKDFEFPAGEFSHVLHLAATRAHSTFNKEYPLIEIYDTVAVGTRHTLDFAAKCKAAKFLYTSSSPVYGRQPQELTHVPEDYKGAPDPTDLSSYNASLGIAKRTAEWFCAYYAKTYGFEAKIARCFSFVGPRLPLDIHYAVGNFIRDGLEGGPIKINGDGTPRRSYLYVSDLIVWLWTMLFKGENCHPYNVGSEEDVSIAELAGLVAGAFGNTIPVKIAKSPTPGSPAERQVPSTKRAQQELGLKQTVNLQEAIARTIEYNRNV